jgi:uncharacterized cupredoxin-like copper-binding protein
LHLTANPSGQIKFNKKSLSGAKGKVTIVMVNPKSSGLKHGIAVEGHGVDKDGKIVTSGHTTSVTVTLSKAGKYEFYCPFDSHKAQGMTGDLTAGGAKAASAKPAATSSSAGSSSGSSGGGSSSGDGSSGGGGY